MLEVRYNIITKELTGWCADEEQFGNLDRHEENEAIVILDIPIPEESCTAYLYDEAAQSLIANPDYAEPPPPLSTHWAIVDSVNLGQEKPVRVKRTWDNKEYTVDCYVSEGIKDQYLAGDIVVGDYVLVEFLEDRPDRAIVFAKVFKTW